MALDPRRRHRRTSSATGSSTTTTRSSCPAFDLPVPGHPNLASSSGVQKDGHGRPIPERRRPRWPPDARAPPAKDPSASRPPPRHPHLAGDLLQVWPPDARAPPAKDMPAACPPAAPQLCAALQTGRRCTPTSPGLSYGTGFPLFTHLPGGGKLETLESLLVTGDLDSVIGTDEAKRYWDWSWDNLVVNDMPSMVDYIFSHTGQKPHFLGHSMGTLVALAAFSEGRTVDKLKSAALLTPVAYLSHMTTPLGILLAKAFVGELITVLGVAEFDPVTPAVASLFKELCRHPGTNCYDLLRDFTGKNYCLNSSAVDVFLQYEPQPTSTKTMVHLAQTFRDGVLSKYDYVWPSVNVEKYGQPDPPAYNMSNIPAGFPLFLSYGGRDELADPGDVRRLLGDLRGHDRGKLTVQYLEQFAHADFVIGTCAKDYVYKDVVAFFNRFN